MWQNGAEPVVRREQGDCEPEAKLVVRRELGDCEPEAKLVVRLGRSGWERI